MIYHYEDMTILNAIGIAGVLQGLLVSLYLFYKRKFAIADVLLAALLLAMSYRIFKTLLVFVVSDYPTFLIPVNFSINFAIGPLLLMYIRARSHQGFDLRQLWQFTPSLLILASPLFLNQFTEGLCNVIYFSFVGQLTIYLGICRQQLRSNGNANHPTLTSIWWVVLIISAIYVVVLFAQAWTHFIPVILFTVFIYHFSIQLLANNNGRKYATTSIEKNKVETYKEQLTLLLEEKEVYRNCELNLQKMAVMMELSQNKLSRLVNEEMGMSFPDLVNGYRIDAIKKKLVSGSPFKISSIAYEHGFKSTSAFNASFKRREGVTPREYRKTTGTTLKTS